MITNQTFLIVEDEENDIFFLKHAMKKTGITNPVQVVQNGQAAIDYLNGTGQFGDRNMYPIPSIIFLDLKLPQVHGLEVLKWIREHPSLPSILVVVLTSSSLHGDIQRAYRLGANSYVVKPTSQEKLIEIVSAFREWWLRHNEPPPQ
jgi:CheY-like chemotaxis protein